MKKILALVFALSVLSVSNAVAGDAFCEGWEAGYQAGACYQKVTCLPPLVPLCPLAKLGEETFQDGYNRGFVAGLAARR